MKALRLSSIGRVRAKDVRSIRGFGGRPNYKAVVRAARRLYKRLAAKAARREARSEVERQACGERDAGPGTRC